MKNVDELWENLSEVFHDLRSGALKSPQAKELNNTAGKMINSVKLQLSYAELRKSQPETRIKFLES